MKNDDLITVIIPVYNVEAYLDECIESVINQSYSNIEIIAIDDGSTDNSLDILEYYEKIDSRVKVISNSNNGQGYCRNYGVGIANGKYIFFMDSDDYLLKETFEKLIGEIENNDILIYNGISFYEENNKKIFNVNKYFNLDKFTSDTVIKQGNINISLSMVSPCMKLYNKVFLLNNAISFEEGMYGEDVIFWYKCCLNTKKMKYVDFDGYNRRYRANSIMTTNDIRVMKDKIKTLKSLRSFINNINDKNFKNPFENHLKAYSHKLLMDVMKDYHDETLLVEFEKSNGWNILTESSENYLEKIKFSLLKKSDFLRKIYLIYKDNKVKHNIKESNLYRLNLKEEL